MQSPDDTTVHAVPPGNVPGACQQAQIICGKRLRPPYRLRRVRSGVGDGAQRTIFLLSLLNLVQQHRGREHLIGGTPEYVREAHDVWDIIRNNFAKLRAMTEWILVGALVLVIANSPCIQLPQSNKDKGPMVYAHRTLSTCSLPRSAAISFKQAVPISSFMLYKKTLARCWAAFVESLLKRQTSLRHVLTKSALSGQRLLERDGGSRQWAATMPARTHEHGPAPSKRDGSSEARCTLHGHADTWHPFRAHPYS